MTVRSMGRVEAIVVVIVDDERRMTARGVVSIDSAEGPPPAIFWRGELYLRTAGLARYVKARAMFAADDLFREVR